MLVYIIHADWTVEPHLSHSIFDGYFKELGSIVFPTPFERRGGYYSDALQSNQPIMLYGTVIDSEYQQHSTKYSWRTAKAADC